MPGTLISIQNHIATITIDNPTEKNALSPQILTALKKSIEDCDDNSNCRVIILKGSEGNFSAGASLKDSRNLDELDLEEDLRTYHNPLIMTMRNCSKPIIAQVEGVCVGVGFSYALACDIVYAADNARFSMIFTKIGLSADGGGSYFMVKRLGYHRALEAMLTAEMISGSAAADRGLINKSYPANELEGAVNKMASFLATGPYIAFKSTKKNARTAEDGTLEDVLDIEAVNQNINAKSPDFLEGVTAFLQKRPANFTGKATAETKAKKDNDMTIEELRTQISEKAASIPALGTTIKMVLDGNIIFIDGSGESNSVSSEDAAASCTVSTDMGTFGEMVSGSLNPVSAVMGGRVKIDGDMGAAMKLQAIFS